MRNIILILINFLLIGCSAVYYVPNTQNVPVIEEKGQTNIAVSLNSSENTEGLDIQGAYGLTNNIAIQLNTDWVKSSNNSSNGSGNFVELGTGYYKNLSKDFVFETYGLLGFGKFKYNNTNTFEEIKANFHRFGLQPSISYSKKYFVASFSTRFVNINYNSITGNYSEIEYLKANNSYFLIEPALTMQFGDKNIKLFLQFQTSENQTNQYFNYDNNLISIGLKINLVPKDIKEFTTLKK